MYTTIKEAREAFVKKILAERYGNAEIEAWLKELSSKSEPDPDLLSNELFKDAAVARCSEWQDNFEREILESFGSFSTSEVSHALIQLWKRGGKVGQMIRGFLCLAMNDCLRTQRAEAVDFFNDKLQAMPLEDVSIQIERFVLKDVEDHAEKRCQLRLEDHIDKTPDLFS